MVRAEIVKRLRARQARRSDFSRVHPVPTSPGDVPDEPEARLVILGPVASGRERLEASDHGVSIEKRERHV